MHFQDLSNVSIYQLQEVVLDTWQDVVDALLDHEKVANKDFTDVVDSMDTGYRNFRRPKPTDPRNKPATSELPWLELDMPLPRSDSQDSSKMWKKVEAPPDPASFNNLKCPSDVEKHKEACKQWRESHPTATSPLHVVTKTRQHAGPMPLLLANLPAQHICLPDGEGYTPMQLAVKHGNFPACMALLAKERDLSKHNISTLEMGKLLQFACEHGFADVCTLFESQGFKSWELLGECSLKAALAGHVELVEFLMKDQRLPLSCVANAAKHVEYRPRWGSLQMEHLQDQHLLRGTKAQRVGFDRLLVAASQAPTLESASRIVALLLLERQKVCESCEDCQKAYHKKLYCDDHGPPSLLCILYAGRAGYKQVVQQLVDAHGGHLAEADRDAHEFVFQAAYQGHLEVVRYFDKVLELPIERRHPHGSTPLKSASQNDHLHVVKYLKEQQADLDAASNNGETGLSVAALTGRVAVVKYLVSEGADLEVAGAVWHAAKSGHHHIIKYLHQHGALLDEPWGGTDNYLKRPLTPLEVVFPLCLLLHLCFCS